MDKDDVFELEHGKNFEELSKEGLEQYRELVSSYDLDFDKFHITDNWIYPYYYEDGTVRVEISQMSKEFFDLFKVKEKIEFLKKKHKELMHDGDYKALFGLIDKPLRFTWFFKLFPFIEDKDLYDIFISIYTSSEYGFNEIPAVLIETILKLYKPEDKDNLETEQDVITVYRGEGTKSTSYDKAFSWTLDINVARKFANRFGEHGKIYRGFVHKESILCYISSRTEKELLIAPGGVFDVEEA